MKEAIIIKLVQLILKLALPYLRKIAQKSDTKVDDMLIEMVAKLTNPTTPLKGVKE